MRRIAVAADGVLDKLRVLSTAVAGAYAWDQAQATVFIVCGVTPLVEPVRAKSVLMKIRHGVDLGWSNRINLDVDPGATPEQVLSAFMAARKQGGISRLRPLSAKHSRLAAFAGATHADETWAERQRRWNATFPRWRYDSASNFRRDALRAQARLLYPGRHPGATPLRGRS